MADDQLRDEILSALSTAGAYCGECGFEPGETGCPDCVRVRELYADALMPIVSRHGAVGFQPGAADDQLRDRIAAASRTVQLRLGPNAIGMAQRSEPIILSGNEADAVAEAVLAVVQPELDRLRAERDQFADRVDTLTAVAKSNKRAVQEMHGELQRAEAERDAARAQVAAARALHQPIDGLGFDSSNNYVEGAACTACGTHDEFAAWWPCGTARALDTAADPTTT